LAVCAIVISGCGSMSYKSSGSTMALTQISCGTQALTGPQTKTCSVSLSSPALTAITVNLSSSHSALKVP
ncbi:hypothetical protein RSW78_26750, partial [Escherichia coli]|uniref:hypothetical protein n=1 Tax=Escherichia coli TaxID=562 RepID=UPI0028E0159B